jgi:DNA-binding MarR family transcriptional regulator
MGQLRFRSSTFIRTPPGPLTVKVIDYLNAGGYLRRMSTKADEDVVVVPALLRAARGSYAQAISASLAASGFDDLPRNGSFVLGGMGNHGASASDMINGLGVTKQAASQLIDTLVLRGYLRRETDAEDRRRLRIELTERGRSAATAVRSGVLAVDAELAAMISPTELAGLRAGLHALGQIKERMKDQS